MIFFVFILFIVLQRFTELYIAKRNEKWLLKKGAVEYGQNHYPFIIALHTLFILSLIIEYNHMVGTEVSYVFLLLFVMLFVLRIWTISSLGKYWNTKIFRIPGMHLIKRGPYKFARHPNYIIVIAEIAVTPLVFHLYFTAILFSLLNAIALTIRVKEENNAWR